MIGALQHSKNNASSLPAATPPAQAKIRYMSEFDRIEAETIPHSKAIEMRGRTSMWYMLESAFMDPAAAKTLNTQFLTVVGHVLVIAGPTLYPWNLAVMWKKAFQEYTCEVRLKFPPFFFPRGDVPRGAKPRGCARVHSR